MMNEENLRTLANYLLSGDLKARFTMIRFSDMEHSWGSGTVCGSVGCAVGHGPYAGIPKYDCEEWDHYSVRQFGLDQEEEPEWDWCFSEEWYDTDNTPEGAGKRILWLLEHGLPNNWEEQMYGDDDLCYV